MYCSCNSRQQTQMQISFNHVYIFGLGRMIPHKFQPSKLNSLIALKTIKTILIGEIIILLQLFSESHLRGEGKECCSI